MIASMFVVVVVLRDASRAVGMKCNGGATAGNRDAVRTATDRRVKIFTAHL